VETELEEQVALEQLRRFVRESTPAKVRMDGEIAEVRDPRAAVGELEAQRAGAAPFTVLDLDDEASELVRLRLGALDFSKQSVALARARAREVGLDVLVRRQLDEEADIVRVGSTESDPLALNDAHGAGVAGAG
jgi:hypothetical protein